MRILFVTKTPPFPARDGSAIRNLALLKELSKNHEIVLIFFVRSEEEFSGVETLKQFCSHIVPIREPRTLFRRSRDLLKTFLGKTPYTVLAHTSKTMQAEVRDVIHSFHPDIIQIQELYLCGSLREFFQTRICILDLHNRESEILNRLAIYATGRLKQFFLRRQAALMDRYESWAAARVSAVVSLTPTDMEWFRRFQPNVIFLPNGVDERESCTPRKEKVQRRIFFVGSLNYPPNRDAVIFFLERIWPRIQKEYPEITFDIVGAIPASLEYARWGKGITFHGIKEDLTPFLEQSSLLVVPLRAGGGSRLKILEAFNSGLPVISTSIGIEGIPAESEEHLLVADGDEAFASAVLRLLGDQNLRERLAKNAFAFAQDQLRWSNLLPVLEDCYRILRKKEPS